MNIPLSVVFCGTAGGVAAYLDGAPSESNRSTDTNSKYLCRYSIKVLTGAAFGIATGLFVNSAVLITSLAIRSFSTRAPAVAKAATYIVTVTGATLLTVSFKEWLDKTLEWNLGGFPTA